MADAPVRNRRERPERRRRPLPGASKAANDGKSAKRLPFSPMANGHSLPRPPFRPMANGHPLPRPPFNPMADGHSLPRPPFMPLANGHSLPRPPSKPMANGHSTLRLPRMSALPSLILSEASQNIEAKRHSRSESVR